MPNAADTHDPEQWLADHGDALYAYALTRVREPATAEDLVQDTLLAGWLAKGEFRGGATLRTWLIGILKNKIIDYLRKAGRETSLELQADDVEVLASSFDHTGHWLREPLEFRDPAAILENEALGRALLNCIQTLPDSLRRVFVLREVDGMETSEIVTALGISSVNNVWVMLSRARERMRECLEGPWAKRN